MVLLFSLLDQNLVLCFLNDSTQPKQLLPTQQNSMSCNNNNDNKKRGNSTKTRFSNSCMNYQELSEDNKARLMGACFYNGQSILALLDHKI